jgi:hypothetical protein
MRSNKNVKVIRYYAIYRVQIEMWRGRRRSCVCCHCEQFGKQPAANKHTQKQNIAIFIM